MNKRVVIWIRVPRSTSIGVVNRMGTTARKLLSGLRTTCMSRRNNTWPSSCYQSRCDWKRRWVGEVRGWEGLRTTCMSQRNNTWASSCYYYWIRGWVGGGREGEVLWKIGRGTAWRGNSDKKRRKLQETETESVDMREMGTIPSHQPR